MTESAEDPRIRELFQRLKRADERDVPPLDQVLARCRPEPVRIASRAPWALAGAVAAMLLISFVVFRPAGNPSPALPDIAHSPLAGPEVPDAPGTSSDPPPSPGAGDLLLDFDEIRQSVEDYFHSARSSEHLAVQVWSSRTESLLTVKLNPSTGNEL